MSTSSETLLSQFIDAWTSGERPDVDAYVSRAADSERDLLEREIHTFLLHAPTPSYSDEVRDQIAIEPLTRAVADMPGELGLWPTLLPSLRKRAQLRRDQVVERLAEALGVGPAKRKVARYYHGMEAGTLEPQGVSKRVLEALASVLPISLAELEEAGRFRGFASPGPQAAYGRTYDVASGQLDVVPAMASPGVSAEEWDEVDELFLGGR